MIDQVQDPLRNDVAMMVLVAAFELGDQLDAVLSALLRPALSKVKNSAFFRTWHLDVEQANLIARSHIPPAIRSQCRNRSWAAADAERAPMQLRELGLIDAA